jgi:nitrite reductase/ring-hydroxylating ferredoxin subunit
MRPLLREVLVERLEQSPALERWARPVQRKTRKAIPDGSSVKDLLSGTWLGHPLHPVLTDVVIGSWTSAWFLDLFGGEESAPAARKLIGIGVLAAVPTAAAGLSDWSDLGGAPRRVGILHAAGNVASLLLYAASWSARRKGRSGLGVGLSMLGSVTATGSAFLGGHLSFGRGVGVNQTAFEDLPSTWTPVIEEQELAEGKPKVVDLDGTPVMLYRSDGTVHAILDRCSHRGCSLADGKVDDGTGTVTCPCHGSQFRLADGSIVHGPATAPQPAFAARVNDGKVEIRSQHP